MREIPVWYLAGAGLVAVPAFFGIWGWALFSWGLLGIVFGWLPAIIGAAVLGALWPIVAGVGLWVWANIS